MGEQNRTTATRPSDLKLNNRRQILEIFKAGGVHSMADIAREVGVSRQTVTKAVQFFLDKDVIVSMGKAASGSMGGKRAEIFSLSAEGCLFGVLICPDYVFVSLFNLRCEVIDTHTVSDIEPKDIDAITELIGKICNGLMEEHGICRESVRGVCVATSGIVCRSTKRLHFNALFPAWGTDIPIADKLAGCFAPDTLIVVENVGKVCGSVYLHERVDSWSRGAIVFSAWGGVVACLMHNGVILSGRDSLIGEIGHMIIAPDDDEVCGCGSRGCFERQVSPERLRAAVARELPNYPDSALKGCAPDQLGIREVFAASAAGDALAMTLSGRAAHHYATALRNMTLLYNPDWVIFQGDCANADAHFVSSMFGELSTFRYYSETAGQEGPFRLHMDTRPIPELATLGAYNLLLEHLFSDESTWD